MTTSDKTGKTDSALDITQELLNGTFRPSGDLPAFLERQQQSIAPLEMAQQRILDSLNPDQCQELDEGQLPYLPSVFDLDDADQIRQWVEAGYQFREDEDLTETERTAPATRGAAGGGGAADGGLASFSPDLMERVKANPKVQWIIARMRPEQITEELLEMLLQ